MSTAESSQSIGEKVMYVYESDISVCINGNYVNCYNVNGNMAFRFSELKVYGNYYYDNSGRTSNLWLGENLPLTITNTNSTSTSISNNVIYNENNIKITYNTYEWDNYGSLLIKLLIENNTNQPIRVRSEDESVNGFMISAYMSELVQSGKKSNAEIQFYASSLTENNISSFNEAEFWLDIINSDTYDDIAETNIITITPNGAKIAKPESLYEEPIDDYYDDVNFSDDEAYEILKRQADEIAFTCAETVLRNRLKDPSSLVVNGEKILDSDDYFRYEVKIDYSAKNSFGGYNTDKFYVLLRVFPIMNGEFEYYRGSSLGFDYWYLDSDKENFDWNIEPSDWTLNAIQNISSAETVSLKQILAYPERYEGMYVTIEEELLISSNNIKDKYFYTIQSDGKNGKIFDNHIYVYYNLSSNIDDCIDVDADYQKIKVTGYVKTYSNSTDAYIQAYIIQFKK